MLAGKPPYNGLKEEEIFGRIKIAENRVKDAYIRREESKKLSPEAMNFLTRLLNPDPNERITAAEALEDPWLRET